VCLGTCRCLADWRIRTLYGVKEVRAWEGVCIAITTDCTPV